MTPEQHFKKLENMYRKAPVNKIFQPDITVKQGLAVITMELNDKFHHGAGSTHGSVLFKMLDDAAFFASNSVERKVFVLTSDFHIHFVRPISKGSIIAKGKVRQIAGHFIKAEATLLDENEKELAFGTGTFVKSKISLNEQLAYKS